MEKHRTLSIPFQAIVLSSVLLYSFVILSDVPMPKASWINGDFIKSLTLLAISYVGLVYIMVRVCFKNVKKWEIVLYNVLNVVFVILIYVQIFELLGEIQDIFQDHNPYDSKTQWDNFINYDEEYEYIALPAAFALFIYGIPNAIMTLVFAILSIVFAFKKKTENQVVTTQKESTQSGVMLNMNKPQATQNKEIRFCAHCGKETEKNAKFCKYCGKQIK